MYNLNLTQAQNHLALFNNNKGMHTSEIQPVRSTKLRKITSDEDSVLFKNMTNEDALTAIISSAQEKERKLIGQELHDNVNQILATVRLYIGMLNLPESSDMVIRQKAVEYLCMAIDEIKKVSGELVGTKQNEKSLVNRIHQIVDDLHFSTHLVVEFKVSGRVSSISAGKELTLFRIVQEQIQNILKHSRAKQVNIDLEINNDEIFLSIRDNGVGFDPRKVSYGMGLNNIYERTETHGGSVELQAAKDIGCGLFVTIPV